ncbi:MAG TPA: hypothetical protein VK559_07560 [Ferruginibacter sp.]|nr:hypothetical protein [Ferruginibacter sp.]
MLSIENLRKDLESKSDIEWFDAICAILKKENLLTVNQMIALIGTDKPNLNNEVRGSRALVPFDKRFTWASINPVLTNEENDKPIDFLSFGGTEFLPLLVHSLSERRCCASPPTAVVNGSIIFSYT